MGNEGRYFIGIDPGYSGAVAVLKANGELMGVFDMPVMTQENGKKALNMPMLYSMLSFKESGEDSHVEAIVERVSAMPKQGISSTFRFGETFGAIQMAVLANDISMRLVTPAKWKAHFHLKRDKGASRYLATIKFPKHAFYFSRVKDDGRAEAVLMALYGLETSSHTKKD